MKNQNTINDIKRYMLNLKTINENVNNQEKRKVYSLSRNIPFLVLTAAIGTIATPFIFDGIIPLYSILTSIPGGLIGFFTPKIIHKMVLNSKGKAGLKYRKNKIGDYIDTIYKYNLIGFKNVVNANNINELSNDDLEKFSEQATLTAASYKNLINKKIPTPPLDGA